MRWLLPVLILPAIVFFEACSDTSGKAGFPNPSLIDNLQDLRSAETVTDSLLGLAPGTDGGGLYLGLVDRAYTLSRNIDAERLALKALASWPESPAVPALEDILSKVYRNRLHLDAPADLLCCHGHIPEKAGSSCCPSPEMPADSLHDRLRSRLSQAEPGRIPLQDGRAYIAFCQVHALIFPDSPLSPAYLIEAAKLALAIKMASRAAELYALVYTRFPESEAAPKARFLEAFTLENELHDLDRARSGYQAFIQDYPDDPLVRDAEILLANLGKDPEEMVREFERQGVQ